MSLELSNIFVNYGKISAIRDISIVVPEGKIVTIIGANGAGKSTILRSISGLTPIKSGAIKLNGSRIDTLPAHQILAKGIAQVPEGRRVFPDMTVEENLRTGAFLRRDKEKIEEDLENIFSRFPRLIERRRQKAKTMSGGEQQMLAIGRALMSAPQILLMDEPSMGLAPVIVEEIAQIIEEVNARGLSIVLVEQNAVLALELADHAYVMETGNLKLEGVASELSDNDFVREAYLGL